MACLHERFPVADLVVGRGGEIKKLSRVKSWHRVPECRATRLLVSAADELVGRARLRPLPVHPARVAVVVGTALGGVEEGEKAVEKSKESFEEITEALRQELGKLEKEKVEDFQQNLVAFVKAVIETQQKLVASLEEFLPTVQTL